MQENPLIMYNRRPPTYVSLPSGGKHYAQPPKLTVDGELAVYPLTAKQELLLKSPDSLLNGESIFQVLRHVTPDIPNPHEVPLCDLEAILIAMRLISYGSNMDVEVPCPKCKKNNTRTVDLQTYVANVKPLQDKYTVKMPNDLVVYLRPRSIKQNIAESLVNLEQERMVLSVADESKSIEERTDIYNKSMAYLTEKSVQNLAGYIYKVDTPDGQTFSDAEMIYQWVDQISIDEFKLIDAEVKRIDQAGIDTKIKIECENEECKHIFDDRLQFDPSRFFAVGF